MTMVRMMNNVCEMISIETVPFYSTAICNILRNLGFSDVNTYENPNGSTFISLYIRSNDREYVISKILEWIILYEKRYNENIPCRFRIDNDMSNAKSEIGNIYDVYVSYNSTSIELESKYDIFSMESNNSLYIKNIKKNTNNIIIPIKNHEFIVSQSSYMDTYKNNLMIFDQIKKCKRDVDQTLLIGSDTIITFNILSLLYDDINLNTINDINNVLKKDINNDFDVCVINIDTFQRNIRDIVLYLNNIKKSDSIIILSGIFDLYLDYYSNQVSDIEYKIFRTNRWNSFAFGPIDTDVYDNISGNGY